MTGDAFEMEKPVVFAYEEVLSSTNGFCDTNLLGHGTYGSVYYGVLREQVCGAFFRLKFIFYTLLFILLALRQSHCRR